MDPPLTEIGHRQAELLAEHLATGTDTVDLPGIAFAFGLRNGHRGPGYGIDRLFCSPMWRSLQTAQPVARALGLVPEVWIDIHELGGIFLEEESGIVGYGGKTRAEILDAFPDYVLSDLITDQGWWTGVVEEDLAREDRAIRVAAQLHEWAGRDERIAIISHGGFITHLLKVLFNQPSGWQLFFRHYNTAITRLHFRDNGRLSVDYINRVPFLPPELLT